MPLNFKGNSRVAISVKDYDECLSFYQDVLDLKIIKSWNRSETDQGIVYQLDQIHLELLKGDENPPPNGAYLYIELKDVDELYNQIKDKVDIVLPIKDQPWGHRNFSIKDPAGNILKFFSEK